MFKTKNKKGFTLVELLTTIVILGVLATVATPMVLGVIKSIKKSAAESSAYAYIKAINYQNSAAQSFNKEDKIEDDIYDVLSLKVNAKGNQPVYGEVNIQKGSVKTADMCIGGYYIIYDNGKAEAGEECINFVDNTEPELVLGEPIITTNSISLPFEAKDNDTGISIVTCSYGLSTNDKKSGVINDNVCEMKQLKADSKYFIEIRAKNKSNLSITKTIEITTKDIVAPVWVDNNPGYVSSKKITVTFEKGNVENPIYLIRSTVEGKTSVALKTCTSFGTPKTSTECNGDEITSGEYIESDTWYMLQNATKADITIEENGSLYAAVSDGTQTSKASTITLTTIDSTAPNLSIGTPTTTINSISIPISLNYDNESNISSTTCSYGTSTSYGLIGTVNAARNSCSITGLRVGTTYYYKIVTTNGAGITTTKTGSVSTSSFGTITITASPTSWATSKTIKVTGSASGAQLQYRIGSSGTWTNITSGGTFTLTANNTIYARLTDGTNTSGEVTSTITTIDTTAPSLELGTPTKTTSSIIIPITTNSDAQSGITGTTCSYGTSTSYGSTGTVNADKNSCSITGLRVGTTYYYKVVTTNGAGTTTVKTGSVSTSSFGTITITASPTSWATSKTIKVTGSASGAQLQYKIGSSGTWTNITSGGTFTLTTNNTIYARLTDGTNTSGEVTSTITTIDTTAPSLELGTPTKTTSSIIIPITTNSDAQSGITGTTCSYGTSTSYGSTGTVNADKNSCSITGLRVGTTYYYKVVTTNGAGTTTVKTGSVSTSSFGTITITASPTSWATSKTIKVTGSASGAQLQYRIGSSGTWTNITSGGTFTLTANNTIYARLTDGTNTSGEVTSTITTIDTTAPSLELGTSTTTINSITIPFSINKDDESNISSTTCVYGTTDGIYNYNGNVNSSKSNCSITGLRVANTYYYKVTTTNGAGTTTTRTGSATTGSFGTITITSTPTSWATSKTIKVTGSASGAQLQYRIGSSGTWTNITSGGTFTLSANNTIYARLTDGTNTSGEVTHTVTTIDTATPTLSLGTITKTTSTVIIPFTATDSQTTVSVSCNYGTNTNYSLSGTNSYTTNTTTNKVGSCKLSGLSSGTTYYYKLVSTDASGRTKTETGSVKTGSVNVIFTKGEQYPEDTEYAILKNINIKYESSNLDTAVYYFKSSVIFAAQDGDVYKCGTGTNPGTCETIATDDGEVNTWYKLGSGASEVVLTFTSNGTLYGVVYDGNSYITAKTYTITNMDSTQPELTIGTITPGTTTISIPITVTDPDSGILDLACTYGVSNNTEKTGNVVATSTTTNAAGNITSANYTCTLSGLNPYSTYKYKVVAKNLSTQLKTATGTAQTNGGTISYSTSSESSSYDYKKYKNILLYYSSRGNTPIHYVKTTVATTSNVTGYACGNGNEPGTCSTSGTTSFAAGYWYKVANNPTIKFTSNGTVYALIKDGSETYASTTITLTGIDSSAPNLTIGSISKTTTTANIAITENSDSGSGIISTTCSYGTSTSYGSTGTVNTARNNCLLTGLTTGTTYYYKIVTTNGAGTSTTKTGSFAAATASVSFNVTYPTSYSYDPYKHAEVVFTTTATSPTYYVKTSVATTSNVTGYSCGNSTNPGTCSTTGTTSFSAGYWYKVTSNPKVKFTSNGTVYGLIYDGNQYLTASTRSLTGIDSSAPSLTIGTITKTTTTANIAITTNSDDQSGIMSTTCSYGTSTSYGSTGTVNADKKSCSITGLTAGKTYYYKIVTKNGAGTETTKTGSFTTGSVSVTIGEVEQYPEDIEYAMLKTIGINYQTTNLATATYFFKSTTIGYTGEENLYACGTGTNPGTCDTTLTSNVEANTWYKLKSDLNEVVVLVASTGTIYGVVYDGNSYVTAKTYSITKVDNTQPELTIGTVTSTTSTITIPFSVSEQESGIDDVICEVSTGSNTVYSGTITRNTYSTNSYGKVTSASYTCTVSNLQQYTYYDYFVKVTNLTTASEHERGTIYTKGGSISYSTSYPYSPTSYKQYKNVVVNFSSNGSSPIYYVKTNVGTTSTVTGYSCGNSTNPSTCSSSGTTSFTAGYWYKVSSNPTVKFTSNGTVYGLIMDGSTTYTTSSYSLTYIDSSAPSLTIGTPTKTINSITLPFTANSDSQSDIYSTTCEYGTSTSYGSTGTVNSTKTSCSMTGLKPGTTYYYRIISTNGSSLTTTKTGSTATSSFGTITISASPSSWSTSKTITVSGTTSGASLQYKKGSSGTWTNISSGGTFTISENTTIYARFTDGTNYSAEKTLTVTTIDVSAPELDGETATYYFDIKATTADMPYIYVYDDSPTTFKCEYGTSTSYGSTGTLTYTDQFYEDGFDYKEITCSMKNLIPNTTYYYKYTATDSAGRVSTYTGTFKTKAAKCKRATSLHTATCSSNSCVNSGYSNGSSITFGTIGTSGTLKAGNAFDCDVNGDGTYNATNERFYYVSNLDTNSNYAVLILYSNASGSNITDSMITWYSKTDVNTSGPTNLKNNLPTTSSWKNVSLASTSRTIRSETNGQIVSSFSYSGYAARPLTTQEVVSACGLTNVGNWIQGELDKCNYLMENTAYVNSSNKQGYWLETPVAGTTNLAWQIDGANRWVTCNEVDVVTSFGTRPVIEVDKGYIQY